MDYTVLYRQWRPDTFDAVIGQTPIVRTLKNQVKSGRISHAYLFCGPKGTGKTSVARILARAVNCISNVDGNPCGLCVVCMSYSSGLMDIIEIDAASNNGVDEIRELKDRVKYPPAFGKHKIYIIDEIHMLSTGAFNALLKTLEEPPEHILFVFATTESHKLPATILSRCQRFNFRRIPYPLIFSAIVRIIDNYGIRYEKAALETISALSEGSMRDALSLLDQCIGFCGDELTYSHVISIVGTIADESICKLAQSLYNGDISTLLNQVAEIADSGSDMQVVLRDIINHLRNVMIAKVCDQPETVSETIQGRLDEYQKQANMIDIRKVIKAIELLSSLEAEMRWSAQPRIHLELALIKICNFENEEMIEEVVKRMHAIEDRLAALESFPVQKPALMPEKKVTTVVADVAERKDNPVKDRVGKSSEHVDTQTQDIVTLWASVLKAVKSQRESLYSLLIDAKPEQTGNDAMMLVYPSGMEFNADMVAKEENRRFIEGLYYRNYGRRVNIKCSVKEIPKKALSSEDKTRLTRRVYELFGEDNVEIIDE